MRKELMELLRFFRTLYVSDNRTINTISLINDEIIKSYANLIEKILSNDVILVDKKKLERKFEDSPITIDEIGCAILKKDFVLHSQVNISYIEYINSKQDKATYEKFKDYINNMLTMKLLDYFIYEVGLKEDKSE